MFFNIQIKIHGQLVLPELGARWEVEGDTWDWGGACGATGGGATLAPDWKGILNGNFMGNVLHNKHI